MNPQQDALGAVSRSQMSRKRLFLSYTTREVEVAAVKPIVDDFLRKLPSAAHGRLGVWYDGIHLPKDHRWSDEKLKFELRRAMVSCEFTLAMLSPGYLTSEWCEFEWDQAHLIHAPPPVLVAIWKETAWRDATLKWTETLERNVWLNLCGLPPGEAVHVLLEGTLDFIAARLPQLGRNDSQPISRD